MTGDLSWYSPLIPSYVDEDALAYIVFTEWDKHCPRKTGNMASHNDYDVVGHVMYVWNTGCPYSAYQNYETSYAGWFDEVGDVFNKYLKYFESKDFPEWLGSLIEEAVNG